MNLKDKIKATFLGLTTGDALGVPVEFYTREQLQKDPVNSMRGFGTHNQPAGTWSDDSSLTFCLAESLIDGLNLENLGNRFVNWLQYGYWSARGETFDVGSTTRVAINRIEAGVSPLLAGPADEYSNGNGALMRISPAAFWLLGKELDRIIPVVTSLASVTHGHPRSTLGCILYVMYMQELIRGSSKQEALNSLQQVKEWLPENLMIECDHYVHITSGQLPQMNREEIRGSGYVVHSLEAALWCFLKGSTFKEVVLEAVNLGEDTDTTGAIAGALAGLYYGYENIPEEWLTVLAKRGEITKLAERFARSLKEG